jgi:YfiH family protein
MKLLVDSSRFLFLATTVDEGDFNVTKLANNEGAIRSYAARLEDLLSQQGLGGYSLAVAGLVHGTALSEVVSNHPMIYAATDGLITDRLNTALLVTGADCPPVFIVDAAKRAVALVHSGRKGTAQNIVGNAIITFGERYGSSPADLKVWIGPCICRDHYEVSEERAHDFHDYQGVAVNRDGRWYLSLSGVIEQQLQSVGVHDIQRIDACTYEEDAVWHSYRRDRHQGRATDNPRVNAFVALLR